jgi:hypothetical protein
MSAPTVGAALIDAAPIASAETNTPQVRVGRIPLRTQTVYLRVGLEGQ